MYSFYKNNGGKLLEQETLVSNFFCRNACYCSCEISEICTPLCLKFLTKVTSHDLDPTLEVLSELVSPFGIYDPFPKVTCYRTVQNSEVVRHAMCPWFIF